MAFALATVASEFTLAGMKLQMGLWRVISVHTSMVLITAVLLTMGSEVKAVAVLGFWAGAFLSWFGVRSHIESSISLRMVYLLRARPMTAADLIRRYQSDYGGASRSEELARAGLIRRRGRMVTLTPKGEFILRVVEWLR